MEGRLVWWPGAESKDHRNPHQTYRFIRLSVRLLHLLLQPHLEPHTVNFAQSQSRLHCSSPPQCTQL